MLTCVFFSNMTYLWSIIFVLGKSMADPRLNKKFDASFARLKTVFIFSGFLQIVAFVLSFEEGSFGGSCDDEDALPYLFDALYGLIAMAQLIFLLEKLCGFGNQKIAIHYDNALSGMGYSIDDIKKGKKENNKRTTQERGTLVIKELYKPNEHAFQ